MHYLNLINIYVLITFIHLIVKINNNYFGKKIILTIVTISLITEIVTIALISADLYKYLSISYAISLMLHNFLWIYLLLHYVKKLKLILSILIIYFTMIVINYFAFENGKVSNYNSFIFSSFIFLIIYLIECFNNLKNEKLSFFTSNKFYLITSPILFFLGFSFMFAFNNSDLRSVKILNMELYGIIANFVNIIYYTLINIYLFKELKTNQIIAEK